MLHASGGLECSAAIKSCCSTLRSLPYQFTPDSCTNMFLLFYLTLLLPKLSKTQQCEQKVIGEVDNDWNLQETCVQGPKWQGGKPINIFKRHDFRQNKDTYELDWTPLVKLPYCVTKVYLFVNKHHVPAQENTTPMTYKVDMPECNQEGNFELDLKLVFKGLLNREKCLFVNIGKIYHQTPLLSDFVFKDKTPKSVANTELIKIFWKTNIIKTTK